MLREHLTQLAAAANNGCGLSYDLFVDKFSASVDYAYPADAPLRAQALELAREFGYLTPAEREQAQAELADSGYCSHGIEPNCCPAGCGDLDMYQPDFDEAYWNQLNDECESDA